jgi:ParB family transcriptional regulator, chromosome partitioning protein
MPDFVINPFADTEAIPTAGAVINIPFDTTVPSPYHPRLELSTAELAPVISALQAGTATPLVVRTRGEGCCCFEILTGERTWQAAQRAGIRVLPAILQQCGDRDAESLAWIDAQEVRHG